MKADVYVLLVWKLLGVAPSGWLAPSNSSSPILLRRCYYLVAHSFRQVYIYF